MAGVEGTGERACLAFADIVQLYEQLRKGTDGSVTRDAVLEMLVEHTGDVPAQAKQVLAQANSAVRLDDFVRIVRAAGMVTEPRSVVDPECTPCGASKPQTSQEQSQQQAADSGSDSDAPSSVRSSAHPPSSEMGEDGVAKDKTDKHITWLMDGPSLHSVFCVFSGFDEQHANKLSYAEVMRLCRQLVECGHVRNSFLNLRIQSLHNELLWKPFRKSDPWAFSQVVRLLASGVESAIDLDLAKRYYDSFPKLQNNMVSLRVFDESGLRHVRPPLHESQVSKLMDGMRGRMWMGFTEFVALLGHPFLRGKAVVFAGGASSVDPQSSVLTTSPLKRRTLTPPPIRSPRDPHVDDKQSHTPQSNVVGKPQPIGYALETAQLLNLDVAHAAFDALVSVDPRADKHTGLLTDSLSKNVEHLAETEQLSRIAAAAIMSQLALHGAEVLGTLPHGAVDFEAWVRLMLPSENASGLLELKRSFDSLPRTQGKAQSLKVARSLPVFVPAQECIRLVRELCSDFHGGVSFSEYVAIFRHPSVQPGADSSKTSNSRSGQEENDAQVQSPSLSHADSMDLSHLELDSEGDPPPLARTTTLARGTVMRHPTPPVQMDKPHKAPCAASPQAPSHEPAPAPPTVVPKPLRSAMKTRSKVSLQVQEALANEANPIADGHKRTNSASATTPAPTSKSPRQFSAASPRQRSTASPRQLSAVSPRQRSVVSPRTLPATSPRQLSAVSPRQRSTVSPRQLSAVSPRQPVAAPPRQKPAVSPRQIHPPVSPRQVHSPVSPRQVSTPSTRQQVLSSPRQHPVSPRVHVPSAPKQTQPASPRDKPSTTAPPRPVLSSRHSTVPVKQLPTSTPRSPRALMTTTRSLSSTAVRLTRKTSVNTECATTETAVVGVTTAQAAPTTPHSAEKSVPTTTQSPNSTALQLTESNPKPVVSPPHASVEATAPDAPHTRTITSTSKVTKSILRVSRPKHESQDQQQQQPQQQPQPQPQPQPQQEQQQQRPSSPRVSLLHASPRSNTTPKSCLKSPRQLTNAHTQPTQTHTPSPNSLIPSHRTDVLTTPRGTPIITHSINRTSSITSVSSTSSSVSLRNHRHATTSPRSTVRPSTPQRISPQRSTSNPRLAQTPPRTRVSLTQLQSP